MVIHKGMPIAITTVEQAAIVPAKNQASTTDGGCRELTKRRPQMRKNSNALRAIAVGLGVAAAGTAVALYATPVIAQAPQVAAATVTDTVPAKPTKPDTTRPDTTMPSMPTMPATPSKPDTTKPDTTKRAATDTPAPVTGTASSRAIPASPIKPF